MVSLWSLYRAIFDGLINAIAGALSEDSEGKGFDSKPISSMSNQFVRADTKSPRREEMKMTQIEYRLHAFDLASRRGFADGNMFDHLLREKFGKFAPDKRAVLVECVRRFLIPAIPRKLVTILSGTNNPIQIVASETIDDVEDISVGVSEKLVLQIATEVAAQSKITGTSSKR